VKLAVATQSEPYHAIRFEHGSVSDPLLISALFEFRIVAALVDPECSLNSIVDL